MITETEINHLEQAFIALIDKNTLVDKRDNSTLIIPENLKSDIKAFFEKKRSNLQTIRVIMAREE
jgi:hypothetical protein